MKNWATEQVKSEESHIAGQGSFWVGESQSEPRASVPSSGLDTQKAGLSA